MLMKYGKYSYVRKMNNDKYDKEKQVKANAVVVTKVFCATKIIIINNYKPELKNYVYNRKLRIAQQRDGISNDSKVGGAFIRY